MKPVATLICVACAFFFALGITDAKSFPQEGRTGQAEGSLGDKIAVNAVLDSSLDSKKAKEGDPVVAHMVDTIKSQDGRVILPRGTKLLGTVVRSEARSKGAPESELAIAFEKAILKDGQQMPLKVTIQAIAAPSSSDLGNGAATDTPRGSNPGSYPGSSPGGMPGGPGARPNTGNYPTAGTAGSEGTENQVPRTATELDPNSRGVLGLKGLELEPAPPNSTEASIIRSNGKSVHLDKGTRLLLVSKPATVNPNAG
jgi:hypothetical protein